MGSKKKTMGTMIKILILPGWTKTPQKWDEFVDKIASTHNSVEVLETPGLMTKIEHPWELQDYITWLGEKVESQKGKVILIGHSNGGRIAASFVAQNPTKASKLILIDCAGIYHTELLALLKRNVFKTLAKTGKKLTSSEKARSLIYKLARERDYLEADPILRETMKNLIAVDLRQAFSKISIPTFIIWGKNDKVTPLKDGKIINQLITNSKLYIVQAAKHSPQFTNADEVAKVTIEFIKNE